MKDSSPESRGNRDSGESPVGLVRRERAGILGLTTCEFDRVTGEHLSTTRQVEACSGILELGGVIPGTIEDMEVPCPRLGKCDSCPNRKK
jgi:hypothetical protein